MLAITPCSQRHHSMITALCQQGRFAGQKVGRLLSNNSKRLAFCSAVLPDISGGRTVHKSMSGRQSSSLWDGTGSQEDLMRKDQCITVDDSDNIIGSGSKYDVHRFNASQPQGILHRAFSVFLFDSSNRLLLQQRAASKITFPNVWTNTCCSHPLVGQHPEEVDDLRKVQEGDAAGAKAAAIRKLDHELGIPRTSLKVGDFKFLTRLHYCAPDTVTYGSDAEWGEHEMDYILFARADVNMRPNPEEVQDVKFVNEEQLKELMHPDSQLLWSPWFRIIVNNFLGAWWKDLDRTLSSDDLCDWKKVHKLTD